MTEFSTNRSPLALRARRRGWMKPHRVLMAAVFLLLIVVAARTMRWDWIDQFRWEIIAGLGRTMVLLASTASVGLVFAILFGLVQVAGPFWLRYPVAGFCGVIRGTPLLLQLWLLYYGLGSLLVQFPEVRTSFIWPLLREAWLFAFVSLTISFAAYEGEVMRGAFAGVPRGELEAARAYGMSRWMMFRRIWLPRAFHRALPTLGGDVVFQMKATPLVATITVVDIYGAIAKVRQTLYLTYEPLLFLALIYMILTTLIVLGFRYLESRIPVKA
jgi:polar amino acid transport system permease protein